MLVKPLNSQAVLPGLSSVLHLWFSIRYRFFLLGRDAMSILPDVMPLNNFFYLVGEIHFSLNIDRITPWFLKAHMANILHYGFPGESAHNYRVTLLRIAAVLNDNLVASLRGVFWLWWVRGLLVRISQLPRVNAVIEYICVLSWWQGHLASSWLTVA